jgi:hypothetical protein
LEYKEQRSHHLSPFFKGFKHCFFNGDMTTGTEQKPKNELVLFSVPLLLQEEANVDHTEHTLSLKKSILCTGLTTLPPSCANCREIWEPQPPGTLRACNGIALPLPLPYTFSEKF